MKLTVLPWLLLACVVISAISEAKTVKKHKKKSNHLTLSDNWKLNKIAQKDCKDTADDCKAFGKKLNDSPGSCFNNPDKARNECPVSCKLCARATKRKHDDMGCMDMSPDCASQPNLCYQNAPWAQMYCKATCMLCQPGSNGACDTDVRCPFWGQYGYTATDNQYITNNCPFSSNVYNNVPAPQQPYPSPIQPLYPYQPNAYPTAPAGVTPATVPPYYAGYPQQQQPTAQPQATQVAQTQAAQTQAAQTQAAQTQAAQTQAPVTQAPAQATQAPQATQGQAATQAPAGQAATQAAAGQAAAGSQTAPQAQSDKSKSKKTKSHDKKIAQKVMNKSHKKNH